MLIRLSSVALILIASHLSSLFAIASDPPADLILFNAHVYTVDPDPPTAEAIAIRGDRIVAVGADVEIQKLAGSHTKQLDLGGKMVLPGFVDAHGHLLGLGQGLLSVDLTGAGSYPEVIKRVAERAAKTPRGQWVLGRGWDQNRWPEHEFQEHDALSRATPDHPVFLTRIDGHAAMVNALALERAQITGDTKDPEGGRILRTKAGEATGVFIDNAMGLVQRRIPPPSQANMREAIRLAIDHCKRLGLTTVHDAGVSGSVINLYKEMIDAGEFDLRVYAMISAGSTATIDEYFANGPLLNYKNRLTVRSVKVLIDGALGSRGAALFEPYTDDPGNTGLLTTKPEELLALTRRALGSGFQVCCHAIGDRGNRLVLDAYETALKEAPQVRDARLRIEHAQIVALSDIPRFAYLGVIPSMQPTHATSDMPWAEARVGPERIKGAYAWRKFLDAGCRIAGGSDFPVESANPLFGFHAAISRQDHKGQPEGGWHPEELMTREEAFRCLTIDAAYAGFEERDKGSIEVGKLADLVVLFYDIKYFEPQSILKTEVVTTILGGKVVYETKH